MKIGVLGAGQLGRMLALAGYPLGLEFAFYDNIPDSPAKNLGEYFCGDFSDEKLLDDFAKACDLITYEFENVLVETVHFLAKKKPLFPNPSALEDSQDRLREKKLFASLKIPTPKFIPVATEEALKIAVEQFGYPLILKTRRLGYDGKGQFVLRKKGDLAAAWQALGGGTPLIIEEFVSFDREVSIIAVRNKKGETVFYPLVENHHDEGILRFSHVLQGPLHNPVWEKAKQHALKILKHFDYVGVLTLEFFQVGQDLLANEMAPRVHNSGHWTIEGASASQFENHLRALLGWPMGTTEVAAPNIGMVNIIGDLPKIESIAKIPGAHFHLYGKESKPRRKLGHVTLCDTDENRFQENWKTLRGIVAKRNIHS